MGLTHHDGVSVYGSGFYIGKKGVEKPIAYDVSGVSMGLLRFDAGIVGQSGHVATISTRLNSVGFAVAQNIDVLATANSGILLHANWSGNSIDIYKYAVNGSAATSSRVAWMVFGT